MGIHRDAAAAATVSESPLKLCGHGPTRARFAFIVHRAHNLVVPSGGVKMVVGIWPWPYCVWMWERWLRNIEDGIAGWVCRSISDKGGIRIDSDRSSFWLSPRFEFQMYGLWFMVEVEVEGDLNLAAVATRLAQIIQARRRAVWNSCVLSLIVAFGV